MYRLITEFTIEENILRKQLLKRTLDDVVVDQGQFTTQRISEFITQADVKDMFITVTSKTIFARVYQESMPITAVTSLGEKLG